MQKKLHLIEDAAHALELSTKNTILAQSVMWEFLVFTLESFHVLGDGGLIITNNTNLYKNFDDEKSWINK